MSDVSTRDGADGSGGREVPEPPLRDVTRGFGTGLIGAFVKHPTAPNLLMAILVLLGLYAVTKLNTQYFPSIQVPAITVSVSWPGASAEDVESNIIDVLEPELRFLDDVEDFTSYAREGTATLSLEFYSTADMQKAQADVEQAISRVTTLPEDSEEPKITRIPFRDRVAKVSVTGPMSESAIKDFAKKIRDALLNAGIDRVSMSGARDREIWVKVREADVRRLGVTVSEISQAIRNNSRSLPSGVIDGEIEMQVRAFSERKTAQEIGNIEVKALRTGEKVFLRDIADVREAFDKDGKRAFSGNGDPTIDLDVQRALSQDTLKTMNLLFSTVDELRQTLPKNLTISVYDVRGARVQQRLSILLWNGLQGLAIVLVVLFLFLNARIAFWVAAGIPIAFLATLFVMWLSGQSINMISMFGLIMMLGIIVDDAIVVGEHTATLEEQGFGRLQAAHGGGVRMLTPVMAATLTTTASFFPIVLISGRMGDIMGAIPLVVIAVLIASVIECFLILPGHLRHGHGKPKKPNRFRASFDRGLNAFRDGLFKRFVVASYSWRYTTVALAIASFIIAFGAMNGGVVKRAFFPSPEPEKLTASVVFSPGLPESEQVAALNVIRERLERTEKRLLWQASKGIDVNKAGPRGKPDGSSEAGAGGRQPDRRRPDSTSGKPPWLTEPVEGRLIEQIIVQLGSSGRATGDNLAEIDVVLTSSEERDVRTRTITRVWNRSVPKIAGIERLAITARRFGPPGRDVDVRLQGASVGVLKAAAEELKEALTGFPGVSGVDDDLPYGKQELILELTPRGTALGFTGESVGQQVRDAIEGAIATRFARGDEEITVRVSKDSTLPGPLRLKNMYLVSPTSERVPLAQVVNVREKRGFSVIQRRDGKTTVSVTGDIDLDQTNVPEVVAGLEESVMPALASKYGLTYVYKGRNEERSQAFSDLYLGTGLALALIYIILAWVFGSYWLPFAVMGIIPFGFVGSVFGHWILDTKLTIISWLGLLGLSGILVNDSIILVTAAKERLLQGQSLAQAAIGASQDRFRAVLLTSLTTIGGLFPLLFETSLQAQFLIPMAITMVFGLAAATFLILILVPALLGVGGDIGRLWNWLYGSRAAEEGDDRTDVVPAE